MSQNQTTGTTVAIATPDLDIIDGQITTTSNQVAANFGKLHKNVLRAIERLECSQEFNRLNFELAEFEDAKGEKRPAYRMTRDGFTFLAMGFTGKNAAQWKEAYISAFNKMEAELLKQQAPAIPYSVQPGDTLSKEEADTLRQMIEGTAKKLTSNTKVQGKFIQQAWSKLKSHFKVGYRNIPRHELTEAISIINRHVVQWELVDTLSAPEQQMGFLPQDDSIDVAALLLSGQCDPKPLTPAVQSLIDQHTGRLIGEAYPLIRAHLERRVAWNTNQAQRQSNDTQTVQQVLSAATLGNCLAHHLHSEAQAVRLLLQTMRQRIDGVLGSYEQPLGLAH